MNNEMWVCDVNRHLGSWEGRNFEITSTEICLTGSARGRQKQSNSKQMPQCIMPKVRRPNTTEFKGVSYLPRNGPVVYVVRIFICYLWFASLKRVNFFLDMLFSSCQRAFFQ